MEVVATFAERLKEIMRIRNVRARDITYHTGIPGSSISHYLRGDYDPKQPVIIKLAIYLRVNEAWLIGYDCDMERFEPTLEGSKKEIMEMLDLLSNDDVERVKNFIQTYFIDRQEVNRA